MPVQPLKPIAHGEQDGGFLTSQIVRPLADEGKDWTGGISFFSSCDVVGGIHVCDGGEKDPTVYGDEVEFDPVILYNLQECSGHIGSGIEDDSAANFRRIQQPQLAAEVHSGTVSGNPSFQSSAEDQTLLNPQCLAPTLVALVDLTCEKGINEVILHAPFHTIPIFLNQQLVKWDPIGGRYMMGHIPVIFDCYPNIGPDTPSVASGLGANDVPADDEVWLYATGPIEYARGTIVHNARFNQRTNEHVDVNERLAIYRFDPCSVLSAKAMIC